MADKNLDPNRDVLVNANALQRVANYLYTRPYGEVHQLLVRLSSGIKEVEPKAESKDAKKGGEK